MSLSHTQTSIESLTDLLQVLGLIHVFSDFDQLDLLFFNIPFLKILCIPFRFGFVLIGFSFLFLACESLNLNFR